MTEDIESGTKDADVICTDVWVSMGEPDEVWEERIRELSPYKVTKKVMENAGEQAIFLHCLPAFHDLKTKIGKQIHDKFGLDDMEVTDEVFESPQSKVFDELRTVCIRSRLSWWQHLVKESRQEQTEYEIRNITFVKRE